MNAVKLQFLDKVQLQNELQGKPNKEVAPEGMGESFFAQILRQVKSGNEMKGMQTSNTKEQKSGNDMAEKDMAVKQNSNSSEDFKMQETRQTAQNSTMEKGIKGSEKKTSEMRPLEGRKEVKENRQVTTTQHTSRAAVRNPQKAAKSKSSKLEIARQEIKAVLKKGLKQNPLKLLSLLRNIRDSLKEVADEISDKGLREKLQKVLKALETLIHRLSAKLQLETKPAQELALDKESIQKILHAKETRHSTSIKNVEVTQINIEDVKLEHLVEDLLEQVEKELPEAFAEFAEFVSGLFELLVEKGIALETEAEVKKPELVERKKEDFTPMQSKDFRRDVSEERDVPRMESRRELGDLAKLAKEENSKAQLEMETSISDNEISVTLQNKKTETSKAVQNPKEVKPDNMLAHKELTVHAEAEDSPKISQRKIVDSAQKLEDATQIQEKDSNIKNDFKVKAQQVDNNNEAKKEIIAREIKRLISSSSASKPQRAFESAEVRQPTENREVKKDEVLDKMRFVDQDNKIEIRSKKQFVRKEDPADSKVILFKTVKHIADREVDFSTKSNQIKNKPQKTKNIETSQKIEARIDFTQFLSKAESFQNVTQLNQTEVVQRTDQLQAQFIRSIISNLNINELKEGVVNAHLQLEPEFLGKIDVKIEIHNNIVKLHFAVDNQAVKQMLEAGVNDFMNNFNQQGLSLGEFDVNVNSQHKEGGDIGEKGEGGIGIPLNESEESEEFAQERNALYSGLSMYNYVV